MFLGICFLLIIVTFIVKRIYEAIPIKIPATVGISFLISTTSLILMFTPIKLFTIPKCLLSIYIILAILYDITNISHNTNSFKILDKIEMFSFPIVVIPYFIAFLIYFPNIKESEIDIEKVSIDLPCINIEDVSYYALYDQSGYKYGIKNENNDFELITIPLETKIHYIDENEKAYLEKIIESSYTCYKGDPNNFQWKEHLTVSYTLYVPEGAIAFNN